jgi:hypothetical protein
LHQTGWRGGLGCDGIKAVNQETVSWGLPRPNPTGPGGASGALFGALFFDLTIEV